MIMIDPVMMARDIPIELGTAVAAFGATAITGMAGLIAWMIRQEYARTATTSRENALMIENSELKKEIVRLSVKNTDLEELYHTLQTELNYERKRNDGNSFKQTVG